MPWYNPGGETRKMTPAELEEDRKNLEAFMAPYETAYAEANPTEEELARREADKQLKAIEANLDVWAPRVTPQENPEFRY